MRISDWSSDVCSSDLLERPRLEPLALRTGENDSTCRAVAAADQARLSLIGKKAFGDCLHRSPLRHGSGMVERYARFPNFSDSAKNGQASCRERECQSV